MFLPAIRWCANIIRQTRACSYIITISALRVRPARVGLTRVGRYRTGRRCSHNNLAAAAEWIAGIAGSTLADGVVVNNLASGVVTTGTYQTQVLIEIFAKRCKYRCTYIIILD